jgi:hypothetical protein
MAGEDRPGEAGRLEALEARVAVLERQVAYLGSESPELAGRLAAVQTMLEGVSAVVLVQGERVAGRLDVLDHRLGLLVAPPLEFGEFDAGGQS